MDPNAALAEIRALIADSCYNAAIERFQDLDEWLSRGGFLPAAWDIETTSRC